MLNVNNLTGFGISGGGISALAYQTSVIRNGSVGGTFTLPTCNAGDLILACVGGYVNTGAVNNPPAAAYGTGFTSLSTALRSQDIGGRGSSWDHFRICNSYKIAESGDSEASTTGFLGPYQECAAFFVYRPTGVISSVTLQDAENGTGSVSKTADVSASAAITVALGGAIGKLVDPGLGLTGPTADANLDGIDGSIEVDSSAVVQTPTATDAVFGTTINSKIMTSLYVEVE